MYIRSAVDVIIQLNRGCTQHSPSAVPAPSVVIEEVGMPFKGSEYILSCIVTVDDSVDTGITISSQWQVPEDMHISDSTLSSDIETVGNLQRHNLIFRPLLLRNLYM